jgi:hypothetical protein
MWTKCLLVATVSIILSFCAHAADLPRIAVSADKKGFIETETGRRFTPWGFNYDHDSRGRLIEDYWDDEWNAVVEHFGQMKKLGANVVRVHLQFGKFMLAADRPNEASLNRLTDLLRLAERTGLYLDLTGLGCYHRLDVPSWYDKMNEPARWKAQAAFWQAIAQRAASSNAVFCYDLMNEPVVPAGKRKAGDWLGPDFAGKHFVQFITLDQAERPRSRIANEWVHSLVASIRRHDCYHLITVGLVDWSLDKIGLTSGFVPATIVENIDFMSLHLYPSRGKYADDLKTLEGFAVGKPVLIEETFPLKCSQAEFEKFIEGSRGVASGWLGFYWGKPVSELKKSPTIADAMMSGWLSYFERMASRPN